MKSTGGDFGSSGHFGFFRGWISACLKLVLLPRSFDEMTSTMDVGYPRSIEDDFPGIGDEIDAAAFHYGTAPSTAAMLIHWF